MKTFDIDLPDGLPAEAQIECPYCDHELTIPIFGAVYVIATCTNSNLYICHRPFILSIAMVGTLADPDHIDRVIITCLKIEGIEGGVIRDETDSAIDFPDESPILEDHRG